MTTTRPRFRLLPAAALVLILAFPVARFLGAAEQKPADPTNAPAAPAAPSLPAEPASATTATKPATTPEPSRTREARDNRDARDNRNGRDARTPRRSRDARDSREPAGTNTSALAGESTDSSTNAPAGRLDYGSFRLVAERNIFNTKRSARSAGGTPPPRETRRAPKVESFALVGTMESARGVTAFFDGTSADYRKALTNGATIAGFKVTEVSFGGAKLQSGAKTIELKVTQQLRREEEGEWEVATTSGTNLSTSPTSGETTSSPASSTNSGGGASESAVSDIVRRLMQQREKE